MKAKGHIIQKVLPESIAGELGLEPGDAVLRINEQEIVDIFDYQYLVQDDYIEVAVLTKDGEECILEIEKEPGEDLGLEFENGLMDEYRSCHNKCIFCFIDQMPKGMRETLYFKDDDSRLSFLQGNYVTLTNMSEHDIDRIIRYRLEPINISFQTTNPELRCMMLHNRFAGEALKKADRLFEAGIEMNGQIVLCKGINDGEQLERSISDLAKYLPYLTSVSVVPVGLSDHTTTNTACIAAMALGACIVERHFTDTRERTGPDLVCSMDERELGELLGAARDVKQMLGGKKEAAKEEQVTIDFAFATVVSIKPIKEGEVFTRENLWVKRPGTGEISAEAYEELLGKHAGCDIEKDAALSRKMVRESMKS